MPPGEKLIPDIWRKAVEIQIDALRCQIEALEEKFDLTKDELEGQFEATKQDFNSKLDMMRGKIDGLERTITAVDRNTAEVVAILRDWKGAMNVLKFTSKVIAPIGAIATALAAIFGLLRFFGVL